MTNFINKNLIFFPSFIGLVICLNPYILSGFYFDDIFNSLFSADIQYFNDQFIRIIKVELKKWFSYGRFFPVTIISGSIIWELSDNILTYRLIQITLLIFNVVLFIYLIKKVTNNLNFSLLVLLNIPLVFQFNPRWDPISSFGGLLQIFLAFAILAWIFTYKYIEKRKNIYLILAVFFELIALSTYEVGVLVVLGMTWILFINRKTLGVVFFKALISINLTFIFYIFIVGYLVLNKEKRYEGIEVQSTNTIYTFFSQFFSAFPLAFLNNKILPSDFSLSIFTLLIIIYGIIWITFFKLNTIERKNESNFTNVLGLAMVLLVLPPLLISVSSKYQQLVNYGDPYIVVYLQYWGAAIILAFILWKLPIRKLSSFYRLLILIGPVFISSLTVATNYERIKLKNKDFYDPRHLMELFVKKTFVNFESDKNILLVDSPYLWESANPRTCSNFFSMAAKKQVKCLPLNSFQETKGLVDTDFYDFVLLKRNTDGIEINYLDGQFTLNYNENIKKLPSYQYHTNLVVGPELGFGFYGWEPTGKKTWAWAKGSSQLHFLNADKMSRSIELDLNIESPSKRTIEIFLNSKILKTITLNGSESSKLKVEFALPSGSSTLKFNTLTPPQRLSDVDDRLFAFRIYDINSRMLHR